MKRRLLSTSSYIRDCKVKHVVRKAKDKLGKQKFGLRFPGGKKKEIINEFFQKPSESLVNSLGLAQYLMIDFTVTYKFA